MLKSFNPLALDVKIKRLLFENSTVPSSTKNFFLSATLIIVITPIQILAVLSMVVPMLTVLEHTTIIVGLFFLIIQMKHR